MPTKSFSVVPLARFSFACIISTHCECGVNGMVCHQHTLRKKRYKVNRCTRKTRGTRLINLGDELVLQILGDIVG